MGIRAPGNSRDQDVLREHSLEQLEEERMISCLLSRRCFSMEMRLKGIPCRSAVDLAITDI